MSGVNFPSMRVAVVAALACLSPFACTSAGRTGAAPPEGALAAVPVRVLSHSDGTGSLGEPLAVALDFGARAIVADGSPGRLVRWSGPDTAVEFQRPSGFYPSDVAVSGFFVYAVDEPARRILRFDDRGAYRDVLLNFQAAPSGRRVSPYGVAVDGTGRMAVTDVENHQVLLYDAYLELEVAFGNYGSYEGQLAEPRGVSFAPDGNVLVADTGNRRVQVFTAGGAFVAAVPAAGMDNPLRRPRRAVADETGRILVADPVSGAVFVFARGGTSFRSIVPSGADDFAPTDVELSRSGEVYVADEASRSVMVFEGF
jgi:DNA-binding beta-propeller fold protein YncE